MTARTLLFLKAGAGAARDALLAASIDAAIGSGNRVTIDAAAADQSPLGLTGMRVWDPTPWDVVVQCLPTDAAALAATVDSHVAASWSLVVDQQVAWDHAVPTAVRFTSLVAKLPGIDDATFRERYRGHGAVAREHHVGCLRYVQNHLVPPATGPTGVVLHAVSELSFADLDGLVQRLYGQGQTSIDAVRADTSQFLDFAHASSVLCDRRWESVGH